MDMYPVYTEYTIQDDAKVALVVSGEKDLAESGILAELNDVCKERTCEVDWTFTKAFPKVFMLREWKKKGRSRRKDT